MNPTIAVAILSHPKRIGRAIAPQEAPIMGAPIHLSMHTSAEAAAEALRAAMVEEWDHMYAHGLGPAAVWERARLSRPMVEDGYLAAVVERPVALDDDRDDPGAEEHERLVADAATRQLADDLAQAMRWEP